MLAEMPVDLVCKPATEGLLNGRDHPIAEIAPVKTVLFEDVMHEADVFVFDYPASTTFCESLCTDRPVVLIDLGLTRFSAAVAPLIERRCRIVTATFGHDNRPRIDRQALADAILGGPEREDPSDFQCLLAGIP